MALDRSRLMREYAPRLAHLVTTPGREQAREAGDLLDPETADCCCCCDGGDEMDDPMQQQDPMGAADVPASCTCCEAGCDCGDCADCGAPMGPDDPMGNPLEAQLCAACKKQMSAAGGKQQECAACKRASAAIGRRMMCAACKKAAASAQRQRCSCGRTKQSARSSRTSDDSEDSQSRAEPRPRSTDTAHASVWNPIVTTNGSRTFLTAPATTERAAMWDTPPNPNKHMLWMQGRFVGADRPNRNGALWSSADLELGKPTVAFGPLNWLHEDKHVIGTIADAQFVPAGDGSVQVRSAEATMPATADPHISALAGIWSWLYPNEASVVQMASDAGVLAYSMECIAEAVQCVGPNGCGESYPYMAFSQGQMCAHLKERASTRRLVNPTFLGGAVIVPPTRPGWADANAQVLRSTAGWAEKAYEQAGRPDIPSSTWELLMASLAGYTGSIE